MGVLILGNKSVVKRKSYITMLVFISTIIILFLIVNMNENSSKIKVKGGEGYGMFDKATRIEIIFNDNEYIVSNPDEIEQIIRLCRQNWEPSILILQRKIVICVLSLLVQIQRFGLILKHYHHI